MEICIHGGECVTRSSKMHAKLVKERSRDRLSIKT